MSEPERPANYFAPDGYRYGVMYRDGSVSQTFNGRNQRQHAEAKAAAHAAESYPDHITLARRRPGGAWERVPTTPDEARSSGVDKDAENQTRAAQASAASAHEESWRDSMRRELLERDVAEDEVDDFLDRLEAENATAASDFQRASEAAVAEQTAPLVLHREFYRRDTGVYWFRYRDVHYDVSEGPNGWEVRDETGEVKAGGYYGLSDLRRNARADLDNAAARRTVQAALRVGDRHAGERIMESQKLAEGSPYLNGDPAPTPSQVSAVLHALADHTLLMHLATSDDVAALGEDRAHLGPGWREASAYGRWFQRVGDYLG